MTGGLTFAGGPWNNYVTHAVATMMEQLRGRPGDFGLCTANGGLLTKHAVGVYSTRPPERMIASPVTRTDSGFQGGGSGPRGLGTRGGLHGPIRHGRREDSRIRRLRDAGWSTICSAVSTTRTSWIWFTENEGVGRTVQVSGTTLRSVERVSR